MLSNDTGYGLTTTKMSDPSHGTVTLNADGSFAYVPTNGYSGSDSFTYKDTDSSARTTNTATVSLTVSPGALHGVTYSANGGAGNVPTQGGVSEATTFTVGSGSLLSKAGYTFGGWSDGTSTYAAGATYTMGAADVVLTSGGTYPNNASLNADFTLSMHRLPVGEWIRIEAAVYANAGGWGTSVGTLADLEGAFGHVTKSVLYTDPQPDSSY